MTEYNTEKVPGRVTHVYIGKDAENIADIKSGIVSFEYDRVRDAKRYTIPGATTSKNLFQPSSNFTWKLKFLSDCRRAFFDTDVTSTPGQKALDDDGYSHEIAYFHVIMPIEDGDLSSKTRTYIITGGYALRNRAYIGDDQDAIYEYEGDAEYISYSDA